MKGVVKKLMLRTKVLIVQQRKHEPILINSFAVNIRKDSPELYTERAATDQVQLI